MIAFAGNSLLCRLALKDAHVDAVTFTSVRLLSGALALWLLVRIRGTLPRTAGSWTSALALFAYAIGFSLAYLALPAGTGALRILTLQLPGRRVTTVGDLLNSWRAAPLLGRRFGP